MKVNIYRKGCKSESMDNTSNDRAINAAIIQEMQNQLNKLIAKHGCSNLMHPDILEFSQRLDDYIAKYTSIMHQNRG
ncbi:MAG: Spo0E family sporulation regulatory protein-aspartic acid phosphatase [Caldicoprobacterales bacterium]|jgi:hypothetical protein|nr:aspartyl-phosphate phosphatase Spo0E family protein [Clostridiales bacterium]